MIYQQLPEGTPVSKLITIFCFKEFRKREFLTTCIQFIADLNARFVYW